MTIYFVLVGSVAFISIFLVIELGKRMARHKDSTSLKAWECLEKQALKRNGVIAVDEETLRTELSFSHDEIEIAVSILSGRDFATYATFQCDFFPDKDFRFASKRFRALINSSRTEKFSGDLLPGFGVEGNSSEIAPVQIVWLSTRIRDGFSSLFTGTKSKIKITTN